MHDAMTGGDERQPRGPLIEPCKQVLERPGARPRGIAERGQIALVTLAGGFGRGEMRRFLDIVYLSGKQALAVVTRPRKQSELDAGRAGIEDEDGGVQCAPCGKFSSRRDTRRMVGPLALGRLSKPS